MSYELRVGHVAQRDVGQAISYFETFGQGGAFLDEIDRVLQRLARRPLSYQVVYGTIRRALVVRFSYAVFFRVAGTTVRVLAVRHQRRDPSSWPAR